MNEAVKIPISSLEYGARTGRFLKPSLERCRARAVNRIRGRVSVDDRKKSAISQKVMIWIVVVMESMINILVFSFISFFDAAISLSRYFKS